MLRYVPTPRCALLVTALGLAGFTLPDPPVHAGTNHRVRRPVSGTGVHYFTTAVVHSKVERAGRIVQRSTETVELQGDLAGRVLYHPVSTTDLSAGTLINTGHQVFSGTVLGSAPVLLYDDRFEFRIDLNTGATAGEVHLTKVLDGPDIRCDLRVTGTGMTPDGNARFEYRGECGMER